jgi:hypothetical protein
MVTLVQVARIMQILDQVDFKRAKRGRSTG